VIQEKFYGKEIIVADREFVEMVHDCIRSFLLVDLLLCCINCLLHSTFSFGAAKYLHRKKCFALFLLLCKSAVAG